MGVCERCKRAQATFHLTDIKPSGEKIERHLCEKCAGEAGLVPPPDQAVLLATPRKSLVAGWPSSASGKLVPKF